MPRLETTSGWSRFKDDVASLFSPRTGPFSTRIAILKQLLLRSVRISLAPSSSSTLSPPLLPLRIRPAFVLLNILDLTLLGILGFHPRGQTWIRINDKLLHFICFLLATAMFYMIWDVDEPARASWVWRHASLILTGLTCFVVGGVGSEIVQSLLPYKVFQWGDIVANLLGSSLGLFFSYHLEKRYRARRELERLYAPLDIEDYGDLDGEDDEEEQELRDVTRAAAGLRSSLKQASVESSNAAAAAAGKKKTRFDANIWDDSIDIDTAPTLAKQSHSTPSSSSSSVRKQDLFAIDDDDDDEVDADANKGAAAPAEANVWKQADS